MCNLYRMTKSTAEVARLFAVEQGAPANFAAEVYPGAPGLVVAEGRTAAMVWGFPLVLKGKLGQPLKPKPVTNAREDKLLTGFWRESFVSRRCLIPVSQWAEAEGAKGAMTRTWYGLPGAELSAVAGLWRASTEWGQVYTMVMVDGHGQMADVHDRMPLVLDAPGQAVWLGGSADAALKLCEVWPGELTVERTAQRWAGEPVPPPQATLF